MMKQWRTKTHDNMDEQPRAVRRRGILVGAATLVATALASRGIGTVEADSPALPAKTHTLLYDMQSPNVWYEDFGEGTLVNGKAEIIVAADFATAVDTSTYHVFLTSYDPASKGIAVAARQADRFIVQEHAGGMSSLAFSWRMVARPKGATAERMPTLTLPDLKVPDPNASSVPLPSARRP